MECRCQTNKKGKGTTIQNFFEKKETFFTLI